jgi:hypothetical protein
MESPYNLHLLPVIYRELNPDQLDPIFEALKIDERLRNEFLRLKVAKAALLPLNLEPSDACISKIMDYSRAMAS